MNLTTPNNKLPCNGQHSWLANTTLEQVRVMFHPHLRWSPVVGSLHIPYLGICRLPPATSGHTNTIIHQRHQGLLTEELQTKSPTPRQHPAHAGCQFSLYQHSTHRRD